MNKLDYEILRINSSITLHISRPRREWSYPEFNAAPFRSSQYASRKELYCSEKFTIYLLDL